MAASANNRMNQIREPLFFLLPVVVTLNAIRAFHDENVRSDRRDFSFHEVTVFLPRVVSRVKYLQAGNVDEEHARAQNVSRMVGCESDARTRRYELVHRNRNDRRK